MGLEQLINYGFIFAGLLIYSYGIYTMAKQDKDSVEATLGVIGMILGLACMIGGLFCS